MSKNNSKPIFCIELQKEFGSIKEAAEYLGMKESVISKNLHGHSIKVNYSFVFVREKDREKTAKTLFRPQIREWYNQASRPFLY